MARAASLVLSLLVLALLLPACGRKESASTADIEAAREAFAKGFYLEAETGYERYLQKEPQGRLRQEAWTRLLEIAQNVKGDNERSVMLMEAMYLEYGTQPGVGWNLLYQMGDLYELQGNLSKAQESWEKCLPLSTDPDKMTQVLIRLAKVRRNLRDYDQAQEFLERCTREAPTAALKARCLYESAQTYTLTQSFGRAKTALLELLKLEGVPEENRALASFLLVDVYEREGRLDEARKLLESIRNTYPNPKVIEARLQSLGKK